ncbi:MAG: hypothetical protein GXO43_02310 [Crenarchaeota archaeon]|nr:hypothetical protein [Thermoproteota archaeon]
MNAIFVVNSTADANDLNPGDGECNASTTTTECTFRAAIEEANDNDKTSIIDTIVFAISDPVVISSALGQIDIRSTVLIFGDSVNNNTIDCSALTGYCIGMYNSNNVDSTIIENLTIVAGGTAIDMYDSYPLRLTNVIIDADQIALQLGGSTISPYANIVNSQLSSSTDKAIAVYYGTATIEGSNITSDGASAIYVSSSNNTAHLIIRNSTVISNASHGIEVNRDDNLIVNANTITAVSNGIKYYDDGVLSPDSIAGNTITSTADKCISLSYNGTGTYIKQNNLVCLAGGIEVVNNDPAQGIPSIVIDSNIITVTGRNLDYGAINIDGCNGCTVSNNIYTATDTAGYFILLKNVNSSTIEYNKNDNDAGRNFLISLENSANNTIQYNRWSFTSLKDSTAGIKLAAGSNNNSLTNNYISNVLWAGIVVYDSSSNNTFSNDSLIQTAGIQLRPVGDGRYDFPYSLEGITYDGAVAINNTFDNEYVESFHHAVSVIGMDSTTITNSYLKTTDTNGFALVNAGSKVVVDGSTLEGAGAGYAVSLEYYYATYATADDYANDVLFTIGITNTEFTNVDAAIRVVDMDTSYIKLDTLFDDNGNINNTISGSYGAYLLPVVVQTLDLSCSPSVLNIDTVKLGNALGYQIFNKVNTADALWSLHWEDDPSVDYNKLWQWYLTRVLYYDPNNGNSLTTTNDHTVLLYGANGTVLDYSIPVERGLVNYTDPCPVAGPAVKQTVYPKTVDNRWLVLKVQYDPDLLPVEIGEDAGRYVLRVGVMQIPVVEGEEVGIYSTSGRLIRKVRVSGDRKIDLAPGVYFIKTKEKTYRVPVF